MNGRLWGGIAAALVLLTLLVAVPLLSNDSNSQLSAYDDGDFGLSQAREALSKDYTTRNVASSALILRDLDANSTLLVVAGLERPYTDSEVDALDQFLTDGGAVLLLDDYGYGEDFTTRYGIQFLHRPLLDANFDTNQSFVRVAADLGEAGRHTLLLNAPSGLRDVAEADRGEIVPFIVSSSDSYLDLDTDGSIDVADKVGPFNVGLRREVGKGTLYVIADAGWTVNSMVGRDDNEGFLLALAADKIPKGGLVLFDESKRNLADSEAPLLATQRATLAIYRNIPALGLTILAATVFLAVLALLRLPGRESWVHRFTPTQYVPPAVERTKRDLVVSILEAKRSLDTGSGVTDPLVESALRDPAALRDADLPRLLEHVRSSMDLELPPGEST